MHDDVLILLGEFLPLHVQRNGMFFGNSFEHALEVLRVRRTPWRYCALQNR